MKIVKGLLRAVIISLITLTVFLLGCQARLMYFPNPYRAESFSELEAVRGSSLEYKTSQGPQTAFYVPPRTGDATALPEVIWLCAAGNGSLALDWLQVSEDWDDRFAYLLVDYPGYGNCAGAPRPDTIRENTTGAVARLAAHLGVGEEQVRPRLAALGHSLGCAAALQAAEDFGIRRVVLIAPFTTMTEMARRVVGWPLCHLNRHRFDNRRTLAAVIRGGCQATLFHGESDDIIPASMSRELAKPYPDTVKVFEVAGAGHNDVVFTARREIGAALRAAVEKG